VGLGRLWILAQRPLGLAQRDARHDLLAVGLEHLGRELAVGAVQDLLARDGGVEPA